MEPQAPQDQTPPQNSEQPQPDQQVDIQQPAEQQPVTPNYAQPEQSPQVNVAPEQVNTLPQDQPVPPPQASFQQPQQTMPLQNEHDPGHGMGIASLILSILGFGLFGIIFGVIAIKKSKKAGRKGNILGLIGVIWGVVSILLLIPLIAIVAANFQGAQGTARDSVIINRVNTLQVRLEENYNDNGFYPRTVDTTTLANLPEDVLRDYWENDILIKDSVNSESEALASAVPNASMRYIYVPYSCFGYACAGYVIAAQIEKPAASHPNPYIKTGLMNL